MKSIRTINTVNIIFVLIFIAMISIFVLNPQKKQKSAEPAPSLPEETEEDWALFIINKEKPVPEDYTPELETVFTDEKTGKEYQLDKRCAFLAVEMIKAAERDGVSLFVCSAYRSVKKQEENFNDYVNHLIGQGYTENEAIMITASQIAYPGESEHNAGLSMDIVTYDWFNRYTEVTEDFENTREFEWLADNSYKYGFILRYPKGAENITGFIYEPWHYRYVGIEHAEQIYLMEITLEEYLEKYNPSV